MCKNNRQILKLILFISLPFSFSCVQDFCALSKETPFPHANEQNIDRDELIYNSADSDKDSSTLRIKLWLPVVDRSRGSLGFLLRNGVWWSIYI